MVDIVGFVTGVVAPQVVEVADGGDNVVGSQRHIVEGNVRAELTIHSETPDASESITRRVEELFAEEFGRLFEALGVSWSKFVIDCEERVFVRDGLIFMKGIEQEFILGGLHNGKRFDTVFEKISNGGFGAVGGDNGARGDGGFVGELVRIVRLRRDLVDGDEITQEPGVFGAVDLHDGDVRFLNVAFYVCLIAIEGAKDIGVCAILVRHGA